MAEQYKDGFPPEVTEAFLGAAEVARLKQGLETLLDSPEATTEKTVGKLAESFLATETSRVNAGKLGLSRASMNRICLRHFTDWLNPLSPVDSIDELKWQNWYNFLTSQIASKIWIVSHCDRIFAVAKRFVRYLWEMRLIELPRNLDSRNLSFAVSPSKIVVWTTDEIKKLLSVATGQTRLHVLLMLNCGFLGKDISDLRQEEIDWHKGTITRKRSKTKDEKNTPEVTYKLWPETFALLKEYRSDDGEIALLTTTGKRWITETQEDGRYFRSDSVASCMTNWKSKARIKKPTKALRATSASLLLRHPSYKILRWLLFGTFPAYRCGEKLRQTLARGILRGLRLASRGVEFG